jgi:hypothetical protein
MNKRLIFLAGLAVLAGCAGTKQAAVEPAATPAPVAAAEAVPTPQPAAAQSPERVASLVVADVTPTQKTPTKPGATQAAADPYHYQCMLAWAKGMQGALSPWTQTAQACDTRAPKP